MEMEHIEHIDKINARCLLPLVGQVVSIKKLSAQRESPAIEIGDIFTGKLDLITNDAVMAVLVDGRKFGGGEWMRTSIVVNVEKTEGGILVHTMNSTYLVTKVKEAQ